MEATKIYYTPRKIIPPATITMDVTREELVDTPGKYKPKIRFNLWAFEGYLFEPVTINDEAIALCLKAKVSMLKIKDYILSIKAHCEIKLGDAWTLWEKSHPIKYEGDFLLTVLLPDDWASYNSLSLRLRLYHNN
eukprot:TRINITY_DN3027_c0_g1_i1.p1 TRINITY_DN3027_c0_g1~~TRINITY_DN3027_c0_g1_i1.p1  ORF type:complete len:135 (-),score=24.92 TRINITY_DN3027_c0_g1_i1:173-577(-)